MKTAPLPDYAAEHVGKLETRADGSVWRSEVSDTGRHYAIVWKRVSGPGRVKPEYGAEWMAHVAVMALLTPDQWKDHAEGGRDWYARELRSADYQRSGVPGCCGLMGGDGKKLGDFRETQAHRLWALPATELSDYIPDHRLAMYDALDNGLPVSAIAVDAYNAHRGRINLPAWYVRDGDFYRATIRA